MFSFTNFRSAPYSATTPFITGSYDLQGPHHGAQKSTNVTFAADSSAGSGVENMIDVRCFGASASSERVATSISWDNWTPPPALPERMKINPATAPTARMISRTLV